MNGGGLALGAMHGHRGLLHARVGGEEVVHADPQRFGDLDEVGDRRGGLRALQPRQERFGEAGAFGELRQRQAVCEPRAAKLLTQLSRDLRLAVHAATIRRSCL